MNGYIKKNCIPIIIEIMFIISCFWIPKQYFIYSNFIFYVALFIFFIVTKEIDFQQWKVALKSGKKFWIQTVLTGIAFLIAFILTSGLEGLFPKFETGMIVLQRNSIGKLILFAFSTILLPAVTEETFYRKNLIQFQNKKILIITAILSMFLFALEHAIAPWGILLVMIWALPLSVSYIKTKNIYVPMTAHFIGSLLGNGFDVIFTFIKLL